ncbi:MAG: hypothetical protein LBR92_03710 [Puniceicoccales bacterium]|jgi:hypothetical protein|nr:hypothetical protein [Puniceicoccales bacterium]
MYIHNKNLAVSLEGIFDHSFHEKFARKIGKEHDNIPTGKTLYDFIIRLGDKVLTKTQREIADLDNFDKQWKWDDIGEINLTKSRIKRLPIIKQITLCLPIPPFYAV